MPTTRFTTAMTRVVALVSTVLLAAILLNIPSTPWSNTTTPQADAQTNRNWTTNHTQFSDCSLRQAGTMTDVQNFAQQLCWIDMKGMDSLTTTPKAFTKNLGRYTLQFNARLAQGKPVHNNGSNAVTVYSEPYASGTFRNAFGREVFTKYAGDTTSPMVRSFMDDSNNKVYRFVFDSIRVIDKATGADVPNYRMVMADAETTRPVGFTELTSVNVPDPGIDATAYRRITPSGYNDACPPISSGQNVFGPGVENYWDMGDPNPKDFVCKEDRASSVLPNAGTFLVGADAPKTMEISMFSYYVQGFALALDFGQMGGDVTANTQNEQASTGTATKFDFSMSTRAGSTNTPVPWQGKGVRTQVIRNMSNAAGQQDRATDSQVFTSKADAANASVALRRYQPTWTCTTSTTTTTITEGNVPAGYTLNNDVATGKSELLAANPTNAPLNCAVDWQPRFQTTQLTLSKTVDGTASDFTEMQNRRFTLAYECTAPTGFAAAYPNTTLKGQKEIAKGESFTVGGLPVNSNCVIREDFASGEPAVRPGKDLDLTWSSGTASSDDIPTTTVRLRAGSNNVNANNNYDFRSGTVTINKRVTGDPVSDFGNNRDYRFELKCPSTPFAQTQTLRASGTGDLLNGTLSFTGVPVERDCTLRPLSGLSAAESETINFDGRDVTVGGRAVQADGNGAYPVRLPDYPEGGTPTSQTVGINAKYSYKSRDVAVVKQVSGPASSYVNAATYPVTYRCTVPGDPSGTVQGTMDISTNAADPAKITGVRVGSECVVYEENTPGEDDVTLDRTTIRAGDASDQVKELTNDEAKTQPILKVSASTDALQNRVVVTNHYVNKTGAVSVQKNVARNGINVALPSEYEINFRCGTRAVELPNGTIRDITLNGTTTISGGSTEHLRVSTGDSAVDALVNDKNGNLGVPYGNECTFSEQTPRVESSGVLWDTDAEERSMVVNSDNNNVNITNDFSAAGDGVTITQNYSGVAAAAQDVDYELVCRTDTGDELPLTDEEARFTLTRDEPTHTVPAESVPEGSECTLTETSEDNGQRTNGDGVDYPVDRDSVAEVVDGDSGNRESQDYPNLAQISQFPFTVGEKTVVTTTHEYEYKLATLSASKTVNFDAATANMISDQRKDVKRNREFDVQVVCTPPNGGTAQNFSGKVSSVGAALSFPQVPIGSTCVATEGETTTAEGIDVHQEVSAGGERADKSVEFVVHDEDTPVEMINTYSRRTATVELNKIANTPIDIDAEYPDTPKDQIYYTHNFTMECRDPETAEGDAGVLLGTFSNTITGPGQTAFQNIPVGADCHITGDKFGQLDLHKTDGEGDELETHLKPEKVDWLVDRNDGTTHTDTDLEDGETTSQYFVVEDDGAEGQPGTVVDLTNHYEFVKSKLAMTKKVTATEAGRELLLAQNPAFTFQYQCKGVGYTNSTIGEGNETLKTRLVPADFGDATDNGNGTWTMTYTSPEVVVPSGAWCTFTEQGASNTPDELTHTANPGVVEKRVAPAGQPVASFDFENKYERRTVPVDVAALHSGYLQGASTEGYTYALTCTDPAKTSKTLTFPLNQANSVDKVSDEVKPQTGIQRVDLPVGVDCTIDASASPALGERAELEVTQGSRTPFMEFGTWNGDRPAGNNPTRPLSDVPADEVTEDMKNYSFTFSVPKDARSSAGNAVMTVAGEAMNIRDLVDMQFTKESVGAAGDDATFHFRDSCSNSEFTLRAGETATLEGLPINSNCGIAEVDDSVDDASPYVTVGSHGDRLANVVAVNGEEGDAEQRERAWNFEILPVAQASDDSSSSDGWALTGVNNYPGVSVDKKIDGSPLSSVTGAVADTAFLNHDDESMHFRYTVENNGADALTDIELTEPGLAGRTIIAADGSEHTVPADGKLPAAVCGLDGRTLEVGESIECEFDVLISEPKSENFTYDKEPGGVVTVSAKAGESTVSDSDEYGAFRVKESLAWMLPDSGSKLLVLFLLLGLLLLGYGLFRYLRNRDDEEEMVDEDRT